MTAIQSSLPAGTLQSLRRLKPGAPSRTLPLEHAALLLGRGLAREGRHGLVVTLMGHAALALEVTRASWSADSL